MIIDKNKNKNILPSILIEFSVVIVGVLSLFDVVDESDESDLSRDCVERGCVPYKRFVDICSSIGVVHWIDDDDDDVWRERVVCWANVLKLLFV